MNQVEPGLIILFIFVPMIISLVLMIYLAHVHIDKLEGLLSRSQFVKYHKETFAGLGLMGKVVRSGFIASVLLMPQLMAMRGGIDINQVKCFPPGLKRLVLGAWGLLFLSFSALILFVP
jgi:hypothetical protein